MILHKAARLGRHGGFISVLQQRVFASDGISGQSYGKNRTIGEKSTCPAVRGYPDTGCFGRQTMNHPSASVCPSIRDRHPFFLRFPGLCHLLGGPDRPGGIGVGRQIIAMRICVGVMPGRECRFFLRVMRRVRIRMAHGVVFFLLLVAFTVLTSLQPGMCLRVTGAGFWSVVR